MRIYFGSVLVVSLLSVSACSSITQGTDQDIAVNTNPAGATCVLQREGLEIGRVHNTPGSVNVSKTKHDITIICDKEGFETATYINDSGWETASGAAGIALDVILTLGVSSAIDSATGADNKYTSPVNIMFVRKGEPNPLQGYTEPEDSQGDTEPEVSAESE
jgi:hypothetical protein